MNFEILKTKVENIKDKYSNQKNNISGYLKEIDDVFYDYGTDNDNFAFEKILNDVISGEDCEGLVMGASPNKFYHWKGTSNRPIVTEVDYKLLSELVDEALNLIQEYETTNKKEFDIC